MHAYCYKKSVAFRSHKSKDTQCNVQYKKNTQWSIKHYTVNEVIIIYIHLH